eukprot:TRINITY_DN1997_c0_g1_i21.p1 TRINITY_DN1997_c0_g1~~TRINITY_DN1997_c0_g1_i21.p1  ORF type:complete len:880 (-),score=208.25 TRINITY_DN1997_c0_g1_i21:598-3237(-)
MRQMRAVALAMCCCCAAALVGDYQLLAALNWAFVDVPLDQHTSEDPELRHVEGYHNCPSDSSFFPPPALEDVEGTLKAVLDRHYLRVGALLSESFMALWWNITLAKIGVLYGVPDLHVEFTFFSNDTLEAAALANCSIDCTGLNTGVAGSVVGVRKELIWQETCAPYSVPLLLVSRPETNITTPEQLRDKIYMRKIRGISSTIACGSPPIAAIVQQLYDVRTPVYDSAAIVELMSTYDEDILAATSPVFWQSNVTLSLNHYTAKGILPTASFLRRARAPGTKATPITYNWQRGNEALAEAYEAALMAITSSGYREQLTLAYKLSPFYGIDCIGSFNVPPSTEGTLLQITSGAQTDFIVAATKVDSALMLQLNTTDPEHPSGYLHALYFALVEWIAKAYSLNAPLTLRYKLYNTTDEMFNAVLFGEAHATMNFVPTEQIVNATLVAAQYFRSTCSVLTLPLYYYSRNNSVASVANLMTAIESNPWVYELGAVGLSTNWTLSVIMQDLPARIILIDTEETAIKWLSESSTHVVMAEWSGVSNGFADTTQFFSGHFVPYTSFFRRDLTKFCEDNEFDPSLGEQCTPGSSGCYNCTCTDGFEPTSSGTCNEKSQGNGGTLIAVIIGTVGGSFLVGVPCLIIIIALLIYFRTHKRKPKVEKQFVVVSFVDENAPKATFDPNYSTVCLMKEFPLQCNIEQLTFGLGSHQADVDTHLTEKFTLVNKNSSTLFFRFYPPVCGKFTLEFEPPKGDIKKNAEKGITAHFAVLCTCVVDTAAVIVLSSSVQLCDMPEEDMSATLPQLHGLRHTYLPLHLESKLSTKLDPDELQLVEPPIGEGGFGVVYRGSWRGQEVAIKKVKGVSKDTLQEIMEQFQQEVCFISPLAGK